MKEKIMKTKVIYVTRDNCPYCELFKPQYEALSEMLENDATGEIQHRRGIDIIEANSNEEKNKARRMGVKTVPAIVLTHTTGEYEVLDNFSSLVAWEVRDLIRKRIETFKSKRKEID